MRRTLTLPLAVAALVATCGASVLSQRGTYELELNNESLYYLHMSPAHEDTWGEDRLGADVLEAGDSFTLEGIPAGKYDLQVVDEDRDECVLTGVTIVEDSYWTITTDSLLRCEGWEGYALTVENDSLFDLYFLYVSPADEDRWGADQLGDDFILESDERFTLEGIPAGDYDLKVVDEDGDECVLPGVTLDEDSDWTITTESLLRCEGF